jgi:hypothetical protein
MISDNGIFFSDTFNFVRPYLGRLLTKSNDLNCNICVDKMFTIHLQTRDPIDSK